MKQFRQASILAVAITGLLLLVFAPEQAGYSQDTSDDELLAPIENSDSALETSRIEEERPEVEAGEVPDNADFSEAAKDEALNTFRSLWEAFYANLPKLLIAFMVILVAWLLARVLKLILQKTLSKWKDSDAVVTLVSIAVWVFAIGVAVSIVAGDIRALVGSLGLVGLALSWSLQTPIEGFTGWLQNSFQHYYRVGDRISVGEVFGDVYKIDFLTTTVWEIGAPYRQGFVQAEQPTGRLVTFPNNEILSGAVVNLTRDFPFVWDELAISVANESDLEHSKAVIANIATDLLKDYMEKPALEYEKILKKAGLNYHVANKPDVFVALNESWTDIVVRYLVGARERRTWKSDLVLRIMKELNKAEHKGKIITVYPRQQLQWVDDAGIPIEVDFSATKTKSDKDE